MAVVALWAHPELTFRTRLSRELGLGATVLRTYDAQTLYQRHKDHGGTVGRIVFDQVDSHALLGREVWQLGRLGYQSRTYVDLVLGHVDLRVFTRVVYARNADCSSTGWCGYPNNLTLSDFTNRVLSEERAGEPLATVGLQLWSVRAQKPAKQALVAEAPVPLVYERGAVDELTARNQTVVFRQVPGDVKTYELRLLFPEHWSQSANFAVQFNGERGMVGALVVPGSTLGQT